MKRKEEAQSCLTLCNSMDCSLPGSFVHGIFQARVLEWGAISFSKRVVKMVTKMKGEIGRTLLNADADWDRPKGAFIQVSSLDFISGHENTLLRKFKQQNTRIKRRFRKRKLLETCKMWCGSES